MNNDQGRTRLETKVIVIGYAMSRLDRKYLEQRGLRTWSAAFDEAARGLSTRPASFKNLRDEFDPVHGNSRAGWHRRPLRPNRQRVLLDLKDVSDDALMALVDRIVARDQEAINEAIDSLAEVPRVAHNVAERLLTGRRAEEYFVQHSESLVGIRPEQLLDRRQLACGYDFGVRRRAEVAIEVKGLKPAAGDVLFTDREWTEASMRLDNYWLVVVGNLDSAPRGRVIRNPQRAIRATCSHQLSITAVWRARVSIAG